ncbi:Transcription regulatory protein SNF2 [Giardia lamblia P15]|uniref:Transcription regulatory protein SNF2 n=1 Tax=Giardia intestinalis (strain P15) TaxID=658858 RepID=E1F0I0_GIAIA|nr:Transcription regulatory protein SNF2 [Giardia lamblia P15]
MKTSLVDLLRKPLIRHAFDPHGRGSDLSEDRDRQGAVDHGQNHAHYVQTHRSSHSSTNGECIKLESTQSHKSQEDLENRLQPCSDGPKPPQSQKAELYPDSQLSYLSFGKKMIKVFPNLNITNAHREFMVLYEFDYRLIEFSLITHLTQKRRAFLCDVDLYAEIDPGFPEDVETCLYPILASLVSRPRLREFYRPLDSYYAVNCLLYHDPQPAKTLKTSFLQNLQQQSLLNMRFAAEKREMAATLKQKMLSLTTGNFKLSIVCRHESPLIGKIFGSGLQKYMLPRTQMLTTTGKQGSSGINKYSNLPDFAFKTYTDDMINSLIYMYLRQFENVYTLEDARQKRIFLPPVFLTLLLEITRYELHVMSRLGVDPTVTLETTTSRSTVEAHEISAMLDSILARTNPSDIDPTCTVNYSYLFKTDSFAELDSLEGQETLEKLIESHPGFTERHKALLYQAELGLKLIEYILKNTGYESNLHFEQRLYDQVHIQYPVELTTQPVSIQHGRLKNYQLDGVKFLVSLYRSSNANLQDLQTGTGSSGCLLADDMGCGKTAQSIAFLAYLSDNRISTGMHLIISPLAVSDSWATEFQTWFPNFSILLYKGDQEQRAKYRRHILTLSKGNISVLTDYGGPAIKDKDSRTISGSAGYSSGDSGKTTNQILSNINAIVTTYEYAIKDRSFFRQIDFDVVIVDEASRVKNARGKLIDVLKKSINCRFRILLSGTPIQNNLRELFTLLGLIHPAVFCDYDRFESIFGQVFSLAHTGRNSDLHHTHHGHHGFRRRASTDSTRLDVSDIKTGVSPSLGSVQIQSISTTTSQAMGRRGKRQCGSTTVTFADDLGEEELDSSYSYSNKDSSEDENDSELSRISSAPTEMMVPIESTASLVGAKTASSLPELTQGLPQNTSITKDNIAEVAIQLAENIDKITGLTNSQKTFIVERLHGILKPFLLRRVKTEVLAQLPPKEEIIIRVPLSAFQLFFYNLAIANGRAMTNPELASSLPANFIRNLDIYLRCVCNHPFTALEHDKLQLLYNFYLMKAKSFSARHKAENTDFYKQYGGTKEEALSKDTTAPSHPTNFSVLENMYVNDQIWRVSGKLELLDNILAKLHKTSHRVLIFSQFKKVLDVLSSYLHYRRYNFVRFDGSVKDVDRNSMIRGYNKEDSKDFVFLLSTRAASHGLNLQTADTVIIFDCDYNGTYDQQAQDRCYRLGQVNPVKVFKLYSNTAIESKMLSVATSKLSLATIVMDAGTYTTNAGDKADGVTGTAVTTNGTRKKAKMSTQEYILEVLSAKSAIPDDVHIPTSEEINRYLARSDMEFQTFQMHDIETSLYWRKRNFDEDIPRLDPEIPSVFSEQKDQIYEEMREMNLLEDKQEVVMPNMQIPSAESGGRKNHSAETDSDSTTSDYDEDDSLDEGMLASKADIGGSQQRKLVPKVVKKAQSIKKSMSRPLTAQDLSDSAVFSLCMQVDKSLRDDPAFRNSIVLSSTIIQKTSVVLTPVVDTSIARFLVNHGNSSGVLFLVSTMIGIADLLRREDAYNNLGTYVTQYVSSYLSNLFACFSQQNLTKQPAETVSFAQHLSSLIMAPEFSSLGRSSSGNWDSYLFLNSSESILQTIYTLPLAQQGHPLSAYQLLFTKAALFIMALKLERDVFHDDLLSYLTTDITNATKCTELSYSSLLLYFSSGLAAAVEEQSLHAPALLYNKSLAESTVLNESADATSLFLHSDRVYTDIYIKLKHLPQLSGDVDVIKRSYAWYNGLSQQQRDRQLSYLQYLCDIINHCQAGTASQDQLDPLPIYVRITVNTERLRYLYSSACNSGVTTDVIRLLHATVSFHLRIMAIFNYLIHLIDPLCVHPGEDSGDVPSTITDDFELGSEKESSNKALLTYRILSQFWILPSKTELPSYYHTIPYPRSLTYIYYKLITLSYLSLHEFVADMRQSFKNCLQFNERSSAFCEHAKVCNELTFQQISQHFQYCNANSVISWFTAYERRLSVVKKGYTMLPTFIGCGIYELLGLPDTENPSPFCLETDGEKCKGLILSYGSGADMAGLCAYDVLRYAIIAAKEDGNDTGSTANTYTDTSVRHIKK